MTNKLISADRETVIAIVEHLEKHGSLEAWFATHQETRYADLLMAAHNFHKQIVDDIARRWLEERAFPVRTAYKMARDTWDHAMDERIRWGLPKETITEEHQDRAVDL